MKKKIINIIFNILYIVMALSGLIWGILTPESLIRQLFSNPLDTIKWICITLVPIIIILIIILYCAFKLDRYLINKRKINWKEYPDLEGCCVWLCFSSWFFFVTSIIFFLAFIFHEFTFAPTVIFLLISIFSFWTYFSIVLAKRNSLYLFRSFLVCLSSFITIVLYIRSPQLLEMALNVYHEDLIPQIIIILLFCLILALCIKGFIFSFKPKAVELFKGGSLSYLQILAIVLIWVSIIVLAKTNISLSDITQSDFPPLNTAE